MFEQIISEHYGLSNVVLTAAPRGFVAQTYYVDSDSGRYFAKIVKISADSAILQQSLPVLRELRELGIERINYPISTVDGEYSVEFDGKLLVVFNCVQGRWIFDYPFEPYVGLLGQIHQLSDRIQARVERETFALPFKHDFLTHLDQVLTGTFDNPHESALQAWTVARHEAIIRDFDILEQVANQLSSQNRPMILTHGDAPGNILYDGEQVYLIDWDMVLFAPPERDTWFHYRNEAFLPLYREVFPDYVFDKVAYCFYLYKRYFEDLDGYIGKVLSPDSTDEEKAKNVSDLYQTCDEWLRPLMEAVP